MEGSILCLKYVRRDPLAKFITLAGPFYGYAVPADGDVIALSSFGLCKVTGRIWYPHDFTTDVTVIVERLE